jgi:hypothetical protein
MTPRPLYSPGSWLRRVAQLIFDEDTMTRVVDPTLADLEHEVHEAGDDAAARRTALIRGYVAFWKLAVLSPFVFADWPGRRQFAQSLTHIGAIVVLLVLTFMGRSAWMMRLLMELYPRVSAPFIFVADLGPFVWLLTPIAVAIFAVLGRRSPFRASPTAVILICSATVAAAASFGAAGFVAVFAEIGRGGSAGLGRVIPAVDALAIPSLLALGITAATTIVVSVSQWRARASTAPNAGPTTAVSGTAAFVLAVSMAVSLVAVNQWLVINEDLLELALTMTNPARAAASGGVAAQLSQLEIAIPLMLLGLVISLTILAAAFAAWRGSRTRRPNYLLVWSTRLAVVAMLAGCVWHASVISGQWRTFRTETTALRSR